MAGPTAGSAGPAAWWWSAFWGWRVPTAHRLKGASKRGSDSRASSVGLARGCSVRNVFAYVEKRLGDSIGEGLLGWSSSVATGLGLIFYERCRGYHPRHPRVVVSRQRASRAAPVACLSAPPGRGGTKKISARSAAARLCPQRGGNGGGPNDRSLARDPPLGAASQRHDAADASFEKSAVYGKGGLPLACDGAASTAAVACVAAGAPWQLLRWGWGGRGGRGEEGMTMCGRPLPA